MNTCPVYRRSGGHSYHYAIAGPIGAILAPGLDMKKYADLPFASTLCGSCTHVCPVKIDIHDQLYKWRQVIVKAGHVNKSKSAGIKTMASILSSSTKFKTAGMLGRMVMKYLPFVLNNRLNPWFRQREMPPSQSQSFSDWYKQNRLKGGKPRKDS
jgi:L-lactate dehydrogenase complex protein LldF